MTITRLPGRSARVRQPRHKRLGVGGPCHEDRPGARRLRRGRHGPLHGLLPVPPRWVEAGEPADKPPVFAPELSFSGVIARLGGRIGGDGGRRVVGAGGASMAIVLDWQCSLLS